MPKVPSMSSKELVRLLEKGEAVFVRLGQPTGQYFRRSFRPRLNRRLSGCGSRNNILCIAKGF